MRTKMALALIVALLIATAALAAHHLNGTWMLTITLGDQGGDLTLELIEGEGGKLTGKKSGQLGDEEITGTLKGKDIEFHFDSSLGKAVYKGTVGSGTMEGTCQYGEQKGTFKGTKK